jgi:homeobox-leucine zipper protein
MKVFFRVVPRFFFSLFFLFYTSLISARVLRSVPDMVFRPVISLGKTQLERHENALLKQENDKLRAENMTIREAMRTPICGSCGSPAMLGEVSLEEQHLCIENARLKDELNRVYALATKFLGKPISMLSGPMLQPHLSSLPMPSSSLELAVGGFRGLGSIPSATMPGSMSDFAGGVSSPLGTVITPARATGSAHPSMVGIDRSMLLEMAISAMDELVKLAQIDEPLWLSSLNGSPNKAMLNFEEYAQSFPPCIGVKPVGYVSEASRESGLVIIDDSVALVETLMDEVCAHVCHLCSYHCSFVL